MQHIEHEVVGDIAIVNFNLRKVLHESDIQQLGNQLWRLVDELGLKKILLNWGNVEYYSSAGLGKLITLNKKVKDAGGQLVFCNVNQYIFEVFEITKLNYLFKCMKSEQDALDVFK